MSTGKGVASPGLCKIIKKKKNSRLPDNLDFTQGALLEPLSVALAALRVAHLTLGRGVVVCGAGPIGLATLLAARASGAHPIVVTDLEPTRLAFARELVPSCVPYQVDRALGARANARAIRALFGARGGEGEVGDEYPAPPCVIECTGVESSVCTAAFTVRRGGRIVVVGVGKDTMNNLPFMHLSLSEVNTHRIASSLPLLTRVNVPKIELRFINRYTDTWPAAISCMSAGIVDMRKLVTHTFPLEKAVEGLTLSSDPRNGSIKVHIVDEAETVFF